LQEQTAIHHTRCDGRICDSIGVDDMACIWKTGRTWERVPETVLVEVNGKLGEGIYSKDLMLRILNVLGVDGAISAGLCNSRVRPSIL